MKEKIKFIALFLSGIVLGIGLHLGLSSKTRAAVRPKTSFPLQSVSQKHPTPDSKPFGNITYTKFNLTLPDEFFPQVPPAVGSLKWFLSKPNPPALVDLINSWNLPDPQKAVLLDTNHWSPATNGYFISIPPKLVLQLSPAARQQIYAVLADNENNVGYRYPFRFPADGFNSWFQGSELPPAKVKMVKTLTYTNSGTLCFSDLETLRHVFSVEEIKKLLQTLYETPTFIMKLRVAPDSNLEALVRYWGANNQRRAVKPLLESLAKVPEGSEISVASLLPALPRVLLYTFPNPLQDNVKIRQDCIWSSLNFFNEQPDNRFLDSQYGQQVLQTDYAAVQDAPQYGDLVALYDARGSMMHICIYIADDVVFTKNGVGELQPWVLMKIPDLKLKYASFGSVQLSILRHKPNSAAITTNPSTNFSRPGENR